MKYILVLFFLILTGCSIFTGKVSDTEKEKTLEKNKYLIGSTYKVLKLDTYKKIRDSLEDGMLVTISEIRVSDYGNIEALVKDIDGKQIFKEWYAFSSLGLWDPRMRPVQLTIRNNYNPDDYVSRNHGYGYRLFDNDFEGLRHVPFNSFVKKDKSGNVISAYGGTRNKTFGLSISCDSNKKIEFSYKNSDIARDFDLTNDINKKPEIESFSLGKSIIKNWLPPKNVEISKIEANYSLRIDFNEPIIGKAYIVGGQKVILYPSKESINQILSGGVRASIKTLYAKRESVGLVYLDGFAEMYTRIKDNCY